MGIELVAALSAAGLFVSVFAVTLMWRRPADVPDMYLNRLSRVEAELLAARRDLDQTRKDLAEMVTRYNVLYQDNLRLREVITWLRVQLREHGVEIGRLPEELRDPHEQPASPNSLNVRIQQGGVSASDQSTLRAGGDVVGRDKTENKP